MLGANPGEDEHHDVQDATVAGAEDGEQVAEAEGTAVEDTV